jgi:hypothetical protein
MRKNDGNKVSIYGNATMKSPVQLICVNKNGFFNVGFLVENRTPQYLTPPRVFVTPTSKSLDTQRKKGNKKHGESKID